MSGYIAIKGKYDSEYFSEVKTKYPNHCILWFTENKNLSINEVKEIIDLNIVIITNAITNITQVSENNILIEFNGETYFVNKLFTCPRHRKYLL